MPCVDTHIVQTNFTVRTKRNYNTTNITLLFFILISGSNTDRDRIQSQTRYNLKQHCALNANFRRKKIDTRVFYCFPDGGDMPPLNGRS